jgi:hypothetical protein
MHQQQQQQQCCRWWGSPEQGFIQALGDLAITNSKGTPAKKRLIDFSMNICMMHS